jgi:hypothetical protein
MSSPTSSKSDVSAPKDGADGVSRAASVQWNDEDMRTHFANVVNVQSTREQFDLFFGTNRTWNVKDQDAVAVDLSNRLILTPFAAKRLWSVLGNVLRKYETRHGKLDLDR